MQVCKLCKNKFIPFFTHTLLIVSCQIKNRAFQETSAHISHFFSEFSHCKLPSCFSLSCSGLPQAYNRQDWSRDWFTLSGSRQQFQEGCLSSLDRCAVWIRPPLIRACPINHHDTLLYIVFWIIIKLNIIFVRHSQWLQLSCNNCKLYSLAVTTPLQKRANWEVSAYSQYSKKKKRER